MPAPNPPPTPTPTPLPTSTRAPAPARAPKSEYILTDTGNKISRRSQIHGTANIILGGRTAIQASAVIRGDLVRPAPASAPSTTTHNAGSSSSVAPASGAGAKQTVAVSIGRYTLVAPGCVLRPPFLSSSSSSSSTTATHTPLHVAAHTYIAPSCVIEAASIGSYVHIGAGSVIGKFAIVKDRVKILPGTVVPAGMVVASGSVVGGRPGRGVGDVGEGWGVGGEVEGGEGRERWRGVG